LNWLKQAAQALNETARTAAQARQGQLTKPPGALGRLEALAIHVEGWSFVAHQRAVMTPARQRLDGAPVTAAVTVLRQFYANGVVRRPVVEGPLLLGRDRVERRTERRRWVEVRRIPEGAEGADIYHEAIIAFAT